jgi:hypothetical protein
VSNKDKIANYDRLSAHSFRLECAVQDLAAGKVVWGRWKGEQDKYRAGVSRLDGAGGGLLIMAFRYPGQTDSVSVHDLETAWSHAAFWYQVAS